MENIITLKKNKHGAHDVIYRNGANLGEICIEIDGSYVFWPHKNRHGFWTSTVLRAIAAGIEDISCNKPATCSRTELENAIAEYFIFSETGDSLSVAETRQMVKDLTEVVVQVVGTSAH